MQEAVKIEGLTIEYQVDGEKPLVALDNVSLTIKEGELVIIIGPSGCGKSTLLHTVGGLIAPTQGSVMVGGQPLAEPDPRKAAFVFQEYSLLPWKTIVENVAIGLKFAGVDKDTRHEAAMRQLRIMGLEDFADKRPSQLSGGMQQRAAVARALVMEPKLVLMDEPFGALDEQTRLRIGTEISRVFTLEQRSAMFVTHSLDEAVLLGDRIILLSARPGHIVEEIVVDEPRPRSRDYMQSPDFIDIRAHLFAALEPPAPEDDDLYR